MMVRLEQRRATRWLAVVLVVAAVAALPVALRAHDVPATVVVQAFVKPEGDRLHVLIRLPLILLMDLDLPKRGPGYLELAHVGPALERAAEAAGEQFEFFEEGRRLSGRGVGAIVSLPSDSSFATYETALARVHGPRLPDDTDVFWNQGFCDLHLEYSIVSARSSFSADLDPAPSLGDRVQTVVRFITPDGAVRPFQFIGESGQVVFDPRAAQAAWRFVRAGFAHILEGLDHLLFLLCLVIPIRRVRTLVVVVTAFTVAHSLTLIAATFGIAPGGAWFPPLVETLIAVSIVYTALENVVAPSVGRRWLISFAFGLAHGFGFSFALQKSLQFAGSHLVASLLAFNVGVELGQLVVLAALVPALAVLCGRAMPERLAVILLSAIVAHTGWHWMIERGDTLWRMEWPAVDVTRVALVARWVFAVLLVGGIGWWLAIRARRRLIGSAAGPPRQTRAAGSG